MRKTSLNCINELAKQDERVLFIGSDLGTGVLEEMKRDMPERFIMEGVSEQHIIGMAAGLAMEGFIPYVNTIATFLTRRCYEQVVIDLCLHNVPVRLIGNGGGVVYAPLGPTHLAIEDLAIMRVIPNMTVVAPCDAEEMKRLMKQTLDWPDPIYIRLAKGGDEVVSREENGFTIGKGIIMRKPCEVLFVTTGILTQRAMIAANMLENDGIGIGVLHLHTVKPLDRNLLVEQASKVSLLITAEEHTLCGGLGSSVLEALHDSGIKKIPSVVRLGLPDHFAREYGSQDSLMSTCGLNPEHLAGQVRHHLL